MMSVFLFISVFSRVIQKRMQLSTQCYVKNRPDSGKEDLAKNMTVVTL